MNPRAKLHPTHGEGGITSVVLPGDVRPVRLLTADFPIIGESKHPFSVNKKGRVVRSVYDEVLQASKKQFLHSVLLGAQNGQRVEAIDGDFLNCHRSNLRFVAAIPRAEVDPQLLAWLLEAEHGLEVIARAIIGGRNVLVEDVMSDLNLEVMVALTRMAAGEDNLDGFGTDEHRKARFFKWLRQKCRLKCGAKAKQLGDVEAEDGWESDTHLNMDWLEAGTFRRRAKREGFVWVNDGRKPTKGKRPKGTSPDGMEDYGTMGARVSAHEASTWRHIPLIKAQEHHEDVDPDKCAAYPSDLVRQDGQLFDADEWPVEGEAVADDTGDMQVVVPVEPEDHNE